MWAGATRIIRICVVAAILVGTVAFIAVPVAPAAAADPVRFGGYARPQGNTYQQAIDQLEAKIGRDFTAVRRFLWWNSNLSNDTVLNTAVREGAIPLVSIRPNDGGGQIAWADIANAPEGSALDNNMERLGRELASLDGPVWFAFHHEPEAKINLGHGTAEDFKAAWRRVVSEIRGQGADNVEFVWVTTTYAFRVGANDRRYGPDWFPGTHWVDHFAADAYNWGNCRPNIDQIEPWEAITGPWLEFTSNYPNKGIIIAEFGTVEEAGDPNAKQEWLENMRRDLREPKWDRLEALLAFNSAHGSEYPDCQWWLDSSANALQAAKQLYNDPMFGGNEGPPPAEPVFCRVETLANGNREITVENQPGNDVLLRNGSSVTGLPEGTSSYTDTRGGDSPIYTLRVWYNGSKVDYPCTGSTPAADAQCMVNALGVSGIEVTWSGGKGNTVIRRNHQWRTTPGTASGTYEDRGLAAGTYTYTLRQWVAGSYSDVNCGTVTVSEGATDVCRATSWPRGVQLTWSDRQGREVIRRNGSWLTTPADGTSMYWDAAGAGTFTYTLRVWSGASYTDYDCGTVNR